MEWKSISGYEGMYSVSSEGVVKSLDRTIIVTVWGKTFPKKLNGKVLKQMNDKHGSIGYMYVFLCKDGKLQRYYVHRLVASAFLENAENKPTVNHIDGNSINNNVDNLEWATFSENTKHAHDNNLITPCRGEKNPNAKLTEKQAYEIINRYAEGGISQRKLAKEYGVSHSVVRNIIIGRKWPHLIRPYTE